MDRFQSIGLAGFVSVPPVKGGAFQRVLHAERERVGRQSCAHVGDRQTVYEQAVLRISAHHTRLAKARVLRKSQARCATNAGDGIAGGLARSAHEQTASRTQNIPVFIAQYGDSFAGRSVVFRHYLHPNAARIYVSHGRNGLVQPLRNRMGIVQHFGVRFLRPYTEECFRKRTARHFQHRSGQSIHQRRLDENTARRRRENQHGRTRTLFRQHLHRTALAQREIRRYLPQSVRERTRIISRLGSVFSLLQPRTRTQQSCRSDARAMVYKPLKTGIEISTLCGLALLRPCPSGSPPTANTACAQQAHKATPWQGCCSPRKEVLH